MTSDKSIDAPEDAIRYAKNLFRTSTQPSRLKRFVAMLAADLAPNRAAFGERSASGSAARQMLFQTDDCAIDIRVSAGANGRFDLRGQLLGHGFTDAVVEIVGSGFRETSEVTENASFSFAQVPAGEYSLIIRGPEVEIAIEELAI